MAEVDKSEKITINIGLVDLGQIDLLVDEGFYANRTDFIRTAIRRQLDSREDEVNNTVAAPGARVGHTAPQPPRTRAARGRRPDRSSCAFSGWPRSPTTSARSWRWRRSRRSRYSEPSGHRGRSRPPSPPERSDHRSAFADHLPRLGPTIEPRFRIPGRGTSWTTTAPPACPKHSDSPAQGELDEATALLQRGLIAGLPTSSGHPGPAPASRSAAAHRATPGVRDLLDKVAERGRRSVRPARQRAEHRSRVGPRRRGSGPRRRDRAPQPHRGGGHPQLRPLHPDRLPRRARPARRDAARRQAERPRLRRRHADERPRRAAHVPRRLPRAVHRGQRGRLLELVLPGRPARGLRGAVDHRGHHA